jgi:hypothetical protein
VQATARLLRHLLSGPTSTSGIHLAVTHDAVMIPLLAAATQQPLVDTERPDFLEGITLGRASGGSFALYRGRRWSTEHLLSNARPRLA